MDNDGLNFEPQSKIKAKDKRLDGLNPETFAEEIEHDYTENGLRLQGDIKFLFEGNGFKPDIVDPMSTYDRNRGWSSLGCYRKETQGQIAQIACLCTRDTETGDIVIDSQAIKIATNLLTPFILHKHACKNLGLDRSPFAATTQQVNDEINRLMATKPELIDEETIMEFAKQSFRAIERYYLEPEEEMPDYTYVAPPLPSSDSPDYQCYEFALNFLEDRKLATQTWDLVRDYIEYYLKNIDPSSHNSDDFFAQSELIGRITQRIQGSQVDQQDFMTSFMEYQQIVNEFSGRTIGSNSIQSQAVNFLQESEKIQKRKNVMIKKILDRGDTTDELVAKATVDKYFNLINKIDLVISAAEAKYQSELLDSSR